MNRLLLLSLLLLSVSVCGQSVPDRNPVPKTETNAVLPAIESPQAELKKWQQQTLANPANAAAWLNLYVWTERSRQTTATEKTALLHQVVSKAEDYVGGSGQLHLMRYLQSGRRDTASLQKAAVTAGNNAWLYAYLIQNAVLYGQPEKQATYAVLANQNTPLSAGMKEYHYNVLMSADSNATIYARGLTDLTALAVLQAVHGVRPDVKLAFYNGPIAAAKNVYLCLTLGADVLSHYPQATYTGLLLKTKSGSMAELKTHLQKRFVLSQLEENNLLVTDALLYKNYLPSFLLLYNYLKKTSADSEALLWKKRCLAIAEKAGVLNEVTAQLASE